MCCLLLELEVPPVLLYAPVLYMVASNRSTRAMISFMVSVGLITGSTFRRGFVSIASRNHC